MLKLYKLDNSKQKINLIFALDYGIIAKLRLGIFVSCDYSNTIESFVKNMGTKRASTLIDPIIIVSLFSNDCHFEQIDEGSRTNLNMSLFDSGTNFTKMKNSSAYLFIEKLFYQLPIVSSFNYKRKKQYYLKGTIDDDYVMHLTMDVHKIDDDNIKDDSPLIVSHKLYIPLGPRTTNGEWVIHLRSVQNGNIFYTINYKYVDNMGNDPTLFIYKCYKLIYNEKNSFTCILDEKLYCRASVDFVIETPTRRLYCLTNSKGNKIRFYDMNNSQKVGKVMLFDKNVDLRAEHFPHNVFGEFSLIDYQLYYVICGRKKNAKQRVNLFKIDVETLTIVDSLGIKLDSIANKHNGDSHVRIMKNARLVQHNNGDIGLLEIIYSAFGYIKSAKHYFVK